ncbi:dickkopf-related protein 2-like [Menidia menidia]
MVLRLLLLMLSLVLALLASSRRVHARVRLNSIRTVVLRDGHALPANRSAWEPHVDLTLYRCMSDLECSERSFCLVSTGGSAHSRCQACRRRGRRCHRDGMCCPGNRCSTNKCVPDEMSQRIPGAEARRGGWRRRTSSRALGGACLRSSDCPSGFCCARHFWTRICKPLLRGGQVCTPQRPKGGGGGPGGGGGQEEALSRKCH